MCLARFMDSIPVLWPGISVFTNSQIASGMRSIWLILPGSESYEMVKKLSESGISKKKYSFEKYNWEKYSLEKYSLENTVWKNTVRKIQFGKIQLGKYSLENYGLENTV